MTKERIKLLERALIREKAARKEAEKILEVKAKELYDTSEELKNTNNTLENLLVKKKLELKGLFENIIDPYCVIDLQGNILEMNDATANLLGVADKTKVKNLLSFIPKDQTLFLHNSIRQLKKDGEIKKFKIEIVLENKSVKLIHINASLICNNSGKPVAIQGIARDITEEQYLKEQILASEHRFKTLLKNLDTGVLLEDENRNIVLTNQKFCNLFSIPISPVLLIGQDCSNSAENSKHLFKDPEVFVSQINKRVNDKKEVLSEELTMQDGRVLQRDYIPIFKDKTYKGHLWSYKDITTERRAQENLIESENNLKTLVQNLDHGIYMEDDKGIAVLANNKLCEQFYMPMSPDLIPGQDFSKGAEESKVLFQEPEVFYKRYKETIKNKKPVIGEEIRMKDGKILERNYMPLFKNGVFKGHLWSFNDVTLSRNYYESIEKEKQKYRNIIANMNIGLIEVDVDGHVLMVNQRLTQITGFNEGELIGAKASDVLPIDKEYAKKKTEITRKGKADSLELRIKDKTGNIKTCLISSAPNYSLTGEISGTISVILDITRLKNLEQQKEELLKNLEKSNDELQEYAHIVSHDLKSPLRSVFALVSWLKEDNHGHFDQESLDNMALIESTLEKMEQLITDVLNYSSITSDTVECKAVDLNHVVDDLQQILYCPDHITLVKKCNFPVIKGDRTRLQQLFQNLISNAIRYIDKEQGLIEIDCIENTTHYQFSIKDNGIGIEKSYHDKIFKIFHSLNQSKESTGIGLSIVKKIVEQYAGEVWLESTPGQGTIFYFTLKKQ
jgi:PAS domain S-box-containing protein